MHKISENNKRLYLAGWETSDKNDIVEYNIYFWSIGRVSYDDELGCMFVVSRMKQGIIAVLYITKEEFLYIQKKISEHMKKFPAYAKYAFGEHWDFSMMKVRNTTRKMEAYND